MGLDLSVPSYSQLQRRPKTLDVEPYKVPKDGGIVIAVDSTGLKVYGEGECPPARPGRQGKSENMGTAKGAHGANCIWAATPRPVYPLFYPS